MKDDSLGAKRAGRILVVDDETTALKSLRRILEVEEIIIAGYASLSGAVEATPKGAFDFLAIPLSRTICAESSSKPGERAPIVRT